MSVLCVQMFDPDLYPFFPGQQSVARVTHVDSNGRSVVLSKQVVATVQDFFQCKAMRGAETEDDGGDGSSQSHWEQRIFEARIAPLASIGDDDEDDNDFA
jgi:hypothetical protein